MMILQQTRGALSSGDQCSLDLPFAATKSLTARIGPTPTFTRASTASFVGSDGLIQSAATNTPRFDHDPLTLVCKGLLIEESRTNLLSYSQDMSNAIWGIGGTASKVSLNSQTAPSGLSNASIVNITGGLTNYISHSITLAAPTTTFTFSIWMRVASGTKTFRLSIGDTRSSDVTVTTSWNRFTFTATQTVNTSYIILFAGTDGLGGEVMLWGAQLEVGSFASSYIPTTTVSAVRSADVCSITGANFTSFCNQTEGTLSLKSTILASTSSMGGVILSAADRFNCSVAIQKSNSTTTAANVILSYNGFAANFNFANATYGSESKTIIAFRQDDFAASSNGATVLTDTAGTFSTGTYPLNQMQIGSNSSTRMYGWISEIKYYRKRLPNAKLQALTL